MKYLLTSLPYLLAVHGGMAETKPNEVLIMVDDLGWSDLGCYGGEIKTPNIDALAENGLRFRRFFLNAKKWSLYHLDKDETEETAGPRKIVSYTSK